MKVSDLMIRDVFTCSDRSMLGDAVKLMWEHDIGFVPVISAETGALVGIITDRDACIAAYFQGKPLFEIPTQSAMSTRIISVRPDVEVDEAEEQMSEAQVHRLPVIDASGKLVGVISLNDLARRAAGTADEEFEGEVALTLGAICQRRDDTPAH